MNSIWGAELNYAPDYWPLWLTSDSDVWIKRSNRKQPGVRGNKREETLSGKA